MAGLFQNILGGASKAVSSAVASDDFADFATAAAPSAPVHAASSSVSSVVATATAKAAGGLFGGPSFNTAGKPYTAWYRVWERTSLEDFYTEFAIIPIILLVILIHVWGVSTNKAKAKKWADANKALLESEFANVGFPGSQDILKAEGSNVYSTYASGRQNIAFVDVRLTLLKRYNPLSLLVESILPLFMDSVTGPVERIEANAYSFDGKETQFVPKDSIQGTVNSAQDGFVWAIVHKDKMNQLRNDRYDLSLTATKENSKLPNWVTIMSESNEITDTLLTPDIISAVEATGQNFEALIISDQPIDAPKKLDDLVPKKRITLAMKLDDNSSKSPLFEVFLRLPDRLVGSGRFRPEALKRVRATREEEARKLKKIADEEKNEERRLQAEKLKRQERDTKLSKLSAEEQKKFLQKEKEQAHKKSMKKQTTRG